MDWKDIVGKVAPMLGAAIGGPLGSIAVTGIANALGLSEKTEAAITEALAGTTPEQLLALKNADQTFALKMQELGFANAKDIEALAVGDRDSARKREMIVQDKTPRNLAYSVTGGFFGILMFMMFFEIPMASRDIINIMLGTLGASFSGIIGYYFGSTAGSKLKTELLAKADAVKED